MTLRKNIERHKRHYRLCKSKKEPFFWRGRGPKGYIMLEYDFHTIDFSLKDEVVALLDEFVNDRLSVTESGQQGKVRAPWRSRSFSADYGFIFVAKEYADELEEYMRSLILNPKNWIPFKVHLHHPPHTHRSAVIKQRDDDRRHLALSACDKTCSGSIWT